VLAALQTVFAHPEAWANWRTRHKLFVGQVPMHITAEQLRPAFEEFGKIEDITIITDKATRLSKGCGFVTYSREEEARAAIEALSDKCVLSPTSKPLVVKFAEGLQQRMEDKISVGNLPLDATQDELTELFGRFGEVKQATLQRRPDNSPPSATGFIRFVKRADATKAMAALNGTTFRGSQHLLAVKFAEDNKAEPSGCAPQQQGTSASSYPPNFGLQPQYLQPAAMPQMGLPLPMALPPQYMQAMAPPFAPAAPDAVAGHKLFVGMIPYSTGEPELQAVFSQFGPLMEVFMMREKDGRSKGCAFVRFYNKHHADAACNALNGTMSLPGAARALVVKYADPTEPRASRASPLSHSPPRGYFPKQPLMHPPQMCLPAAASSMGHEAAWMGMGANAPSASFMQPQMLGMGMMPNVVGIAPPMGHYATPAGMEAMGMMQGGIIGLAPMQHAGQIPPQYMAHMGAATMEQQGISMSADQVTRNPSWGCGPDSPASMASTYGWSPTGDGSLSPQSLKANSPQQWQRCVQPMSMDPKQTGKQMQMQMQQMQPPPPPPPSSVGPPHLIGPAGHSQMVQAQPNASYAASSHCGSVSNCMGSIDRLERQIAATGLSDERRSAEEATGGTWDRLYVSYLPRGTTEQDLQALFAPFGQLKEMNLIRRSDGNIKGSAFISYATIAEGHAASMALHNKLLPGGMRPLSVRPSTSKARRDSNGRDSNGRSINGSSLKPAAPPQMAGLQQQVDGAPHVGDATAANAANTPVQPSIDGSQPEAMSLTISDAAVAAGSVVKSASDGKECSNGVIMPGPTTCSCSSPINPAGYDGVAPTAPSIAAEIRPSCVSATTDL